MFGMTTRTAIPNCQEFRTQLLARSIRDTLGEGIRLNWIHSGAQLADALMKTHETHDASEVLKNRATARNRMKLLKTSCTENELSAEKM